MSGAKSVLGWTIFLLCVCAAAIACVLTVAPDIGGVSHGARDLYIPVTLIAAAALFNPIAFRHLDNGKAFFARLLQASLIIGIAGGVAGLAGMTRAGYPAFVAERIQHREIDIQARAAAGEFINLDSQDSAARAERNRLTLNDITYARHAVAQQIHDGNNRRAWFIHSAQSAPSLAHFAVGLVPYALGEAYEYGLGRRRDAVAAEFWYRRAAAFGLIQAQYRLGHAMETDPSPDFDAAVAQYKLAADKGLPDAQFALARLYDGAHETQAQATPNPNLALAARYYFMAAAQGHSWAQNNLATCYQTGSGVIQNDTQSAYWYRQAAEQGDGLAAFQLASAYASGRGVAKSPVDYRHWMRQYYLTHNEATPPGL